jgi:L-aminopeptidase/D-esterase
MAREYVVLAALLPAGFVSAQTTTSNARPGASDLGLKIGILPTGLLNAITDVAGVEVGHTTIISGDNIRTGVTAVLSHSGNAGIEATEEAIYNSMFRAITMSGNGHTIEALPIDKTMEIPRKHRAIN